MHTLSATALVRNCLPVYAAALVPNCCLYVGYMKVLRLLLANVRRFENAPLSSSVTDGRGLTTDGHLRLRCHPIAHGPKRHADSCASRTHAKSVLSSRVQFELQRVGAEVLTACIIVYT
jgi:hypothetical protein